MFFGLPHLSVIHFMILRVPLKLGWVEKCLKLLVKSLPCRLQFIVCHKTGLAVDGMKTGPYFFSLWGGFTIYSLQETGRFDGVRS